MYAQHHSSCRIPHLGKVKGKRGPPPPSLFADGRVQCMSRLGGGGGKSERNKYLTKLWEKMEKEWTAEGRGGGREK